MDPCDGFFCGGSDRGTCFVSEDLLPTCECVAGYQNDTFSLYCCPVGNVGDSDCEMGAVETPEPANG
jgi:hypothetical protein